MPRFLPGRQRGHRKMFAACAAGVVLALVAYLMQLTVSNATAAPQVTPSSDEVAAGVLALSNSYPGGLPALLDLFDTGECAGAESYDGASAACQSTLDQIAQLG